MKFFHLADLHLGKRYGEFPLIADQRYVLNTILKYADIERPEAALIAGDIYDKPVPPTDAVELFDWFLNGLADRGIKAFVISGNHDSPERLAFASRLLEGSGVHIAPVFSGRAERVTLRDSYGDINIYSLPFIKPATVRRYFPEEEITCYTSAVRAAVNAMGVEPSGRNVLVAHQFVTGSTGSGSEELVVGDVGNVDAEVFGVFDYVALGHIHGAQNIGGNARYAGAPLKYSLSEKDGEKSVTVVELKGKGDLNVRTLPLTPLRDVYEIRGAYAEVTAKPYYDNAPFEDGFVHLTLTDEEEVPDAFAKLRLIYPNLAAIKYDNARTRTDARLCELSAAEEKSPRELFAELYEKQNNQPMTEEQVEFMKALIEKVWGDGQ